MKGIEVRNRRKDKKFDVKPLLPIQRRESIYRLAFITQMPVKSVAEYLVVNGINNKELIDRLSNSFIRDVRINNTLFRGKLSNPSIKVRTAPGTHERISLRVNLATNEVLSALCYALDCSKARACAVILEYSMENYTIINDFVKEYLESHLDEERMSELKKLLEYINRKDTNNITWAQLLSHIIDEVNTPMRTSLKDTVDSFIINDWRNNQ